MNPVAFTIFGINIMWYALLITTGVVVALAVTNFNTKNKKFNMKFDDVLDAFLWAFPLAIIFARLYYVVFEWSSYKDNPISIFNIRQGGLAIHGGLIGAAIGVLIYKKLSKKTNRYVLELADAAAPAFILAQAIGRWGNFINQEAHGGPVTKEFISKFPQFIQKGMFIDGQYYHPTFLYESIWNLLVFGILMYLFWKKKKGYEGTILAWYLILYSIGRFFIEGMRTDSLMAGSLRQAQLISIVGIVLGAIYLVYKYKHPSKEEVSDITIETDSEVIRETEIEDK